MYVWLVEAIIRLFKMFLLFLILKDCTNLLETDRSCLTLFIRKSIPTQITWAFPSMVSKDKSDLCIIIASFILNFKIKDLWFFMPLSCNNHKVQNLKGQNQEENVVDSSFLVCLFWMLEFNPTVHICLLLF